jgi:DUF971 family protein
VNHVPTQIQLHKKSRTLELQFNNQSYLLSAEYLRVYSPSAEVRGHGANQGELQHGKMDVSILSIERAGHYALKLIFDDDHDSGIYTWNYLYDLAVNVEEKWQAYISALSAAGKSREKDTSIVKFI